MSELLAINTDRAQAWRNGNHEAAAKTLQPRDVDEGKKSAWAHFEEGTNSPEDNILGEPQFATRRLQALALFIFAFRSGGPRRSRIEGVSLTRENLPFPVIEDALPHPLPAYQKTHRSLKPPADGAACAAAVQSIVRSNGCSTWKYSRDDLRSLLIYLLAKNAIALEMRDAAEALLRDWSDSSLAPLSVREQILPANQSSTPNP